MVHLLDFVNCQLLYIFFLFFLGILFLLTSILIILTESSVHSILYLMFLFLYLTELTIVLKMEFLALIFIIVYIGAVCVLMLFHIKLIKTFLHRYDNVNNKELFLPFFIVSIILPILQIVTICFEQKTNDLKKNIFFYNKSFFESYFYKINLDEISKVNYISWIDYYETFKSTQILGFFIYNVYFMCLLIGSLILLVAMVGSIFLTLVKKKNKKFQKIDKQIFSNISKILIMKNNIK